ncbi:hypothetical protein ZIOFF_033204 [Zingiber officinale]|uniref:Helicase/UvrB N-terminal domain-containing protein n=1 Tax=Zingiber officinale TaxID=94328 RepID=A0A8J5GHY7_ZINOF|nr:hypothetical protein ZIOFF_033204 [Zingiber officinale]
MNSTDPPPDPETFARSYQLEVLEKAKKENTIIFLETGSGKTLIAIMLLCSYTFAIQKPSQHIVVFLIPTIILVTQMILPLRSRVLFFALAVSDIVLINMWCHDISREQVANKPLLKTIFQVMLRLFSPRKTTLLFVIRDKTRRSLKRLEAHQPDKFYPSCFQHLVVLAAGGALAHRRLLSSAELDSTVYLFTNSSSSLEVPQYIRGTSSSLHARRLRSSLHQGASS